LKAATETTGKLPVKERREQKGKRGADSRKLTRMRLVLESLSGGGVQIMSEDGGTAPTNSAQKRPSFLAGSALSGRET